MKKAIHGGAFFGMIGEDFAALERSETVINADVLDAWFDPSPKVVDKIRQFLPFILKTSPPAHSEGLLRIISEIRGVPIANILAAGGSSDIIFAFFRMFARAGDKFVLLDPTYGEYAHIILNLVQAELRPFELHKESQFRLEINELIQFVITTEPAFVVIVNPNSPSGASTPKSEFLQLIEAVPKQTTIVIDETYIEYAGRAESLEQDVMRHTNLVIIKSMSKVYALSGVRVGYIVASEEIIDKLSIIIPPWAVSLIGQIAGVEALKDGAYYSEKYRETHTLRDEFMQRIAQIPGLSPYESVANFFLVELASPLSAAAICKALEQQNIFIRNTDSMSSRFHDDFIRIAVKSKEQNEQIIQALTHALRP